MIRLNAPHVARAAVLLLAGGCATGSPSPSLAPSGPSATPTTAASASPTVDLATPSAQPSTPPASGWRQLASDVPSVGPREDHTWTVDSGGGTAYLFGGRRADGTALGDLHAYDLATGQWRLIEAAGPAARFGHNAAWVDGVGLVIFAGQAGATFFNDLWAFDPANRSWRELPAGGDPPVERYGSCAAVGPDGRLWISHGFTLAGRRFADTRAYDFASGSWTDESPAGAVPVARCLHACWWTDDGRFELYAGQTTGVNSLGDLWSLTLGPRQGTHAWSEVAIAGPADRNLYAAARWNDGTIVFGGQALDGSYLSDAWLIADDGTTTLVSGAGSGPAGRSGAEFVADPERGRLLLFGGRNASAAMSDLWELVP